MRIAEPVAITGLGCLCGAGSTVEGSMKTLLSGTPAPRLPTLFSSEHAVSSPVFEVPDEAFSPGLPGEEDLLRTSRLALSAARQAVGDARWDLPSVWGKNVGVCVGTTVGSAMNNEEFYRRFRLGEQPSMGPIDRFLGSNPAFAIAGELGLAGPCQTVVNACSSGTDAIGIGAAWIRAGICEAVIAGGADELCRVTYNGFSSLMITDAGPCRPFDRARKGLNLGEGAAMVVLEGERSSFRRRENDRGSVLGYGSACDSYHLTAPRPDGRGLKKAIEEALATSGLSTSDISFVNAHGTGTRDNDLVEGTVLDAMMSGIPYFSTKGHTGHTLGAAGAIEAVFTVASLEMGTIPASAGCTHPDADIPAPPVMEAVTVEGRIGLTESLAFGGNNAVLVLKGGRG